jgi:biopolymer transport protein ExbB/TolQ
MAVVTIVVIALVAVAAVLILIALGLMLAHKRTDRRRVEAGDIRDKADEQSHEVGQREALAEETAALARVAQAEADAKSAHAEGLQHQAQTRRSGAATARDAVNQEYRRAETMDPDSSRGTAVDTEDPRVLPRSG